MVPKNHPLWAIRPLVNATPARLSCEFDRLHAPLGRESDDEPPSLGCNGERDFRIEQRSSETHASTTDPDAQLYRKARGQMTKLCTMDHLLMKNRSGWIVDTATTHTTGTAECEAAEVMVEDVPGGRVTLESDKDYYLAEHVATPHGIGVTLHVAQNISYRRSAINGRTTRHPGCNPSQ